MLKADLKSYRIDNKEILKDIYLELEDKQNLTILGSNGVGKSTLAKLLTGILKSTQKIKIDGIFLEDIPSYKRVKLINYIPSKLSVYDSYITVYDYLALGFHKSRIDEVLKLLDIESLKDSYCSTLSSGEGQLLLIASALVDKSRLTIFDEPTSNLDPKRVKKVFDILKSNHLKQKIVITHNLQFAYKLGYPIYYIKDGSAKFYKNSDNFFSNSNLKEIFEKSVIKNGDNVVVNL